MSGSKTDYSCYENPQAGQGASGDNAVVNQGNQPGDKKLYIPIGDNDPVANVLNHVPSR